MTAKLDGTFRCRCGAVGWIRSGFLRPYVRDPTSPSDAPTPTQRFLLDALADGRLTDAELDQRIDLGDPSTQGEILVAKACGWITTSLAGLGGLVAIPGTIYELTDAGREARRRTPKG